LIASSTRLFPDPFLPETVTTGSEASSETSARRKADEVRVERQYSPATRRFELPKNGLKHRIALPPAAKGALLELPLPVKADEHVFRASRGGPMTGRVQHYYWHPVRCRFGNPSMDFYELRHFCGAWMFNDLELPAQDVAHQLGHTDGGALVQRLYGHPSERLARERINRATRGKPTPVTDLSEASGGKRSDELPAQRAMSA
jgi:integrase